MADNGGVASFIPTAERRPPPTKLFRQEEGEDVYTWYITEDEYLRLNKIFGRDFQEAGLGGTKVVGLPKPCSGCGKYTEFIDWVWTALQRGVHSSEFMFKALQESRQGIETAHDIYCSECGTLTIAGSRNNAEGVAANIFLAGRLNRSDYLATSAQAASARKTINKPSKVVTWGKWWLDNNGSTAGFRAARRAAAALELEGNTK